MVTHANILANLDHFNYWWMAYREGSVYLHAAPIFHIADFPVMFTAPAFGARRVTIPRFTPQAFCELVQRERETYTVLVPTILNPLTQMPEGMPDDLRSLEVLGYGGSPVAPELVQRVRKLLPEAKLLPCYGLSETGFLTGLKDREHVKSKLPSCGRHCPGIELRIEDETGKEVEAGQHGELVARSANVMHRYWNDPGDTALAFRSGVFHTGDVGYQDSDGYIYVLDRLKDMIVTGGENVYSGEVEAAIYKHPAVRDGAVFGIPDPKWGEVVLVCVVPKPGTTLTADELTALCRQSLASYKIPRRGEFFGNGIIKKRLRQDSQKNPSRTIPGPGRTGRRLAEDK